MFLPFTVVNITCPRTIYIPVDTTTGYSQVFWNEPPLIIGKERFVITSAKDIDEIRRSDAIKKVQSATAVDKSNMLSTKDTSSKLITASPETIEEEPTAQADQPITTYNWDGMVTMGAVDDSFTTDLTSTHDILSNEKTSLTDDPDKTGVLNGDGKDVFGTVSDYRSEPDLYSSSLESGGSSDFESQTVDPAFVEDGRLTIITSHISGELFNIGVTEVSYSVLENTRNEILTNCSFDIYIIGKKICCQFK